MRFAWVRRPRPTWTLSHTSGTRGSCGTTRRVPSYLPQARSGSASSRWVRSQPRGVMLDIARLHGVDHFDENYPITGDDLDRAASVAGLHVESGDAVLVRTGHMHFLQAGNQRRYSMPSPGLSTQSISWIRDHDVAIVATDTMTFEVYPCENPRVFMPVHMIHLRDIGLTQGQNWHLDDLAADCASDGQHDFLLVATPLPLTGGGRCPRRADHDQVVGGSGCTSTRHVRTCEAVQSRPTRLRERRRRLPSC